MIYKWNWYHVFILSAMALLHFLKYTSSIISRTWSHQTTDNSQANDAVDIPLFALSSIIVLLTSLHLHLYFNMCCISHSICFSFNLLNFWILTSFLIKRSNNEQECNNYDDETSWVAIHLCDQKMMKRARKKKLVSMKKTVNTKELKYIKHLSCHISRI